MNERVGGWRMKVKHRRRVTGGEREKEREREVSEKGNILIYFYFAF